MVRHCEFCYAAVPADYPTCPVCGAALRASQDQAGTGERQAGDSSSVSPAATPAASQTSGASRSEFSKKNSFSLSRSLRLGFVLMLFLFLTGLGLLIYGGIYHPVQLRAGATATVSAALTALTQSTAQARAHATATAIAQAHATATAQQATYTAATQGTPTLVDPLTGQNGNLWTLDSNLREGCLFSGSSLHSIVASDHTFIPCLALATSFANFTLQVQMRLARGDGGGLVFRANAGSGTGYLFFVGSDGNYSLMLSDGTQANALVGGPTPAIHTAPGQDNLLTVIARGSSILLYVNKQYVGSAQDTSFSTGQIGVFAIDLGHVTDAAFSQLQVWSR